MTIQVFERLTLDADDVRRTPEGFLVAMPRVARTGIQVYRGSEVGRDDLDSVRVYRPENEVFSKASLRSYTHRPVTNEHPPAPITADNWREYAVGQTGEEFLRDKEFVRVPMVLMDAQAIADFEAGKRQLSLGYGMTLDWTAGKTSDGEDYDASQSDIRANHLAMCKTARGGPRLRIGDAGPRTEVERIMDALVNQVRQQQREEDDMTTDILKKIMLGDSEVTVSDAAASTILRHVRGLETEIVTLRSKIERDIDEEKKKAKAGKDTADAEITTLKAQVATLEQKVKDAAPTPQALDSMVNERHVVIAKAKKVLGDKLVVDGKTLTDIRRQVVDTKLGATAKDWKDEQIKVSFDTLMSGVDLSGGEESGTRDGLSDSLSRQPEGGHQRTAKAYDGLCNDLESAWKGPQHRPGPIQAQR